MSLRPTGFIGTETMGFTAQDICNIIASVQGSNLGSFRMRVDGLEIDIKSVPVVKYNESVIHPTFPLGAEPLVNPTKEMGLTSMQKEELESLEDEILQVTDPLAYETMVIDRHLQEQRI